MDNVVAGIDLGTTFSAISILNTIGKPEIVPNAEGERITPSALFFDEEEAGTVRVGLEAVNSRLINPERSVRWIKRHIGDIDYRKNVDGKSYTPEELSSLILKKLKQDCNSVYPGEIDAVLSVPAHFDEARRKATMDAGKMAGLNVIGIVNEPVAAAVYYAASNEASGRVLVYDLGGGTFDVTILDVKSGDVNIICSQGDHALGGVDFDRAILQIFEAAYREEFNTDLIVSEEDLAKYEDEAEDVKKTLSKRDSARKMLYGSAGSLKFEITREQFEQAISESIGRTEMLIEVALEEASCKPEDINSILLVGGSTRIPVVQKRLADKFGKAPETAVNVDECVALGAAIHAGLTKLRDNPEQVSAGVSGGLKDVKLTDVCNHSYGTISAPLDKVTGKHILINSIILEKNTPLPCEQTQTFYTVTEGQTEIQVTITQGEDSDPDYINKIATEVFKLPPDRPANRPINVTYSYDVNQRMHCTFEDVDSGEKLEVDLDINGQNAGEDKSVKEKSEEIQCISVE